ncbi:hypothetical protein D9742_03720 [Escherichia sp. E1V33]|nr:hypothetical protein D9742_03720 [Escherichia sp. E1V33]TBR66018.1 hypothetical protein D9735_10880 [Escherichia sp. E1S7]
MGTMALKEEGLQLRQFASLFHSHHAKAIFFFVIKICISKSCNQNPSSSTQILLWVISSIMFNVFIKK